ncbi:RNA polymerase sigma factor [Streptomyces sp. NPDC023838]|uniref:RNA polymerase sigma factor n=1 Tax=Streptomyces sp. NPDC023838 TaxID=3154325 RepID=UPI0033D4CFB9
MAHTNRAPSGDAGAFEELFDAHARSVYAHALRMTGDWATAEDVMSITFLEAWRLRDKLRSDVLHPRAWLLGIATNVLRNRARAARRHRAAMERIPRSDRVPDFSDEVVDQMADGERLAAAKRALGRLRRTEREVFGLVVWSGLGYADAAAALGVPVGTVRSRLSRAREKLRKSLEAESAENGRSLEPVRANGHREGSGKSAASVKGRKP